VPPTPAPTPQPTPTPPPPTLSGGSASAGATLAVLGTNWTVGVTVAITWADGSQIGSADVQADGRFATFVRIPQNAVPGQTYRMTASGGGRTATADVVVRFSPTLTLLSSFPPRSGGSVTYTGSGWPANSAFSLQFDGQTISGAGGVTSATGTLVGPQGANPFFTVPANTAPGTHTVTVTSTAASASAQLLTQ
jgi:hypothetical protein